MLLLRIKYVKDFCLTYLKFSVNGIQFGQFTARGVPVVSVSLTGKCRIGTNFTIQGGKYDNMIGRQQQCYIVVSKNASLTIGNNVGMSSSAIICYDKITIDDWVKIGGNVSVYDTDFHSLNARLRNTIDEDPDLSEKAPVWIKEGAFIGANSTILKGVTIGRNAIIGACSLVTKDIPDNEIWGGNPARKIRDAS